MDEKTQIVLKDAFKRFLKEQLGPVEDKPYIELAAWKRALVELAFEIEASQSILEEELKKL
jgi:hypothetical protein